MFCLFAAASNRVGNSRGRGSVRIVYGRPYAYVLKSRAFRSIDRDTDSTHPVCELSHYRVRPLDLI